MFRVRADPEPSIMQDVDGMIVKVQAHCCICDQPVTLQQSGAPKNVQKLNRMLIGELALATIILQSDGKQPFEVMQLQAIADEKDV